MLFLLVLQVSLALPYVAALPDLLLTGGSTSQLWFCLPGHDK
jgi:hypothetical protein